MFVTTVISTIFYVLINEPHYLLKSNQVLCGGGVPLHPKLHSTG